MNEELCGNMNRVYIVPRMVSERYSDIISYGVRIEQPDGGGAELCDVFFRYDDAADFVEYARKNRTEPRRLREAVERFTREHILCG